MANREISVNMDKIERLAGKRGMKIKNLEDEMEIGHGTINKWKCSTPNIKTLFAVAEKLGVPFWKLTMIDGKEVR